MLPTVQIADVASELPPKQEQVLELLARGVARGARHQAGLAAALALAEDLPGHAAAIRARVAED